MSELFTYEELEAKVIYQDIRLCKQTALLRHLAASACDHCGEKKCAQCWAREYK
jgi:hypothetical protein